MDTSSTVPGSVITSGELLAIEEYREPTTCGSAFHLIGILIFRYY
jgi:hypothetical protein